LFKEEPIDTMKTINLFKNSGRAAGIALFCVAWPVTANAANQWDVASGFDYYTGKYGATADTEVWSVPLSLRDQIDRLRLELNVPYLNVRGPGGFAGGVIVGGNNPITTQSGLGDTNVGAAWLLRQDDQSLPAIELAGSIKVPTASRSLGTQKFDYNIQSNFNHSLSQSLMLFGSLGYQWLTDFRGFHLEDGMTATGGVNFRPSDATSVGFSANFRQTYYRTLDDQFTLTPYALWTFAPHWRLSGYGMVGFTNSSPEIGGGVRLIFFQT
jgi:hypothetical protein